MSALRRPAAARRRDGSPRPGRAAPRVPILLPLLLGLCSAAAHAAAGVAELALTEDEAVQLALRNNRLLIGARHQRQVERFALSVSEDRYRPQAAIDAAVRADARGPTSTDLSIGPNLRVPAGGRFGFRWSRSPDGSGDRGALQFSQPLLRGFGLAVDSAPVRLARLDEERNVLLLRDAVADVIVATATAYRSLIRADQAVGIDREALARARRQLEINQSLIGAGRMAAREIVQTEAEVAGRELSLANSENGLMQANARLLSVLDIDDAPSIRPVERLPPVEPLRPDLEHGLETALEHRNDYARARVDLTAAELALRVAENGRLWDLSLNANVSEGPDGERDYGAALGLAIPLGDRAPRLAAMRARGEVRKAELALAELRQSIGIEVRQAIRDVTTGFRQVQLARKARALAGRTVEVEQEKMALGLTSTFQLTTVEASLVDAKTRELDAVIGYLNARTRFDWTLGTTLDTWGVDIADFEAPP